MTLSALEHPGARHVTPLTPGRPNYAGAVTGLARAFRTPPMPWQRHLYALSTERDRGTGEWAYDTVITTVQRRAGKTTARTPIAVHRCLRAPLSRVWLTAQKRQDARDIVIEEAAPRITAAPAPLPELVKVRRSQGSEGLYFVNGSSWRVFAPGDDDLHGKAAELVDVDEGWAFSRAQGAALDQAIAPTMLTTGGQFSVLSTLGTASSSWFHGLVAKARAAHAAGERAGVAIIDYGLPYELVETVREQLEQGTGSPEWLAAMDTLARHHPAYGYTIPTVARFAAAARQLEGPDASPNGILRALGNVETDTAEGLIHMAAWRALTAAQWPRPTGSVVLAIDVGRERSDATVAAAWIHDGAVHLDVIAHRPGADWLPAEVVRLSEAWGRPRIIADRVGPGIATVDELRRLGLDVHTVTSAQFASACMGLMDAVTDAEEQPDEPTRVRHRNTDELTDAARAVSTRPAGEPGMFVFSRSRSSASISPLVAVTLARWGVLELGTAPAPAFHGG